MGLTLKEAAEKAKVNLDAGNLVGFVAFTFHADGMMSSSYSCSTLQKFQVKKVLEDIGNKELFPTKEEVQDEKN